MNNNNIDDDIGPDGVLEHALKRQKTTTTTAVIENLQSYIHTGCISLTINHNTRSNGIELKKARALQYSYEDKALHDSIRTVQLLMFDGSISRTTSISVEDENAEQQKEEANEIIRLLAAFLRRTNTVREIKIICNVSDSIFQGRVDLLLQALIENTDSTIEDLELHYCVPSWSVLNTFITKKRRQLQKLVFVDDMVSALDSSFVEVTMTIISNDDDDNDDDDDDDAYKEKMLHPPVVKINWIPQARPLSTFLPILSLAAKAATTTSIKIFLSSADYSTDGAQEAILGAAEMLSSTTSGNDAAPSLEGFHQLHSLRVVGTGERRVIPLSHRSIIPLSITSINIFPLLMALVASEESSSNPPISNTIEELVFCCVRFSRPSSSLDTLLERRIPSTTTAAAAAAPTDDAVVSNNNFLPLKTCTFEDCYFDSGVSLDDFRILKLFDGQSSPSSLESLTLGVNCCECSSSRTPSWSMDESTLTSNSTTTTTTTTHAIGNHLFGLLPPAGSPSAAVVPPPKSLSSLRHLKIDTKCLPPNFIRDLSAAVLGQQSPYNQIEHLELSVPPITTTTVIGSRGNRLLVDSTTTRDVVCLNLFRHLFLTYNNRTIQKISLLHWVPGQFHQITTVFFFAEVLRAILVDNDTLCTVNPIFPTLTASSSHTTRRQTMMTTTNDDDDDDDDDEVIVNFYLTLNRRGRRLIRYCSGNGSNTTCTKNAIVPLGFWPIILERQENNPSAVYYFLQRKPELFDDNYSSRLG